MSAGRPSPAPAGVSRPPAPRPARRRPVTFLVAPAVVLVLACLAALALGARSVVPSTTVDTLAGLLTGTGTAPGDIDAAAVLSRIPRTVTAILVGAALAVSGVALQGATRNPLGDPGLLGLTAGASLAVALGLGAGLPSGLGTAVVLAILGTVLAAVVVYAVASAASRLGAGTGAAPGPLSLVLAGAAVTAGCTAATSALLIDRKSVV